MHPAVSGKFVSNRNVKNGQLKSIKGESKMSDSPPPVGIEFVYLKAFGHLIDEFRCSKFDLLLEGIQYLIFLKCLFLTDISTISQHEN